MGGYAIAMLAGAVLNGLNAQRKLDGDPGISGPDDRETLQAIVSAGKSAEGELRRAGELSMLRGAYEVAEVPYPGD